MAGKKKKDEDRGARPAKAAKLAKAEKGKNLLPKNINGAKLPKDVRDKLIDLAKHPVVAELVAAGLVALAARIKNEPKVKEGAAKAVSKALDAGAGTGQDMAHLAADIAAAVVTPVVKRIRTAAVAAAAAPTEEPQSNHTAETPSGPAAPVVEATHAESGTAKPRAARRAASKPATSEETDDA